MLRLLKSSRGFFLSYLKIKRLRLKNLSEESDNKIYFYSRKTDLLKDYADAFHSHGYTNFLFKDRKKIETFVKSYKNKSNYFVFVGGKNADFNLAVNTRSLYIVPTWLPLEEKAQKYGIHVNTVKQLRKFIQNTKQSKCMVFQVGSRCYYYLLLSYGCKIQLLCKY